MPRHFVHFRLALAALLWLGGSSARGAVGTALRLEFVPGSGEQAILAEPGKVATLPNGVVITRLDWLVSEIALQRADGTWMPSNDWYGYLSAGSGRLQVDSEGLPKGDFRGVRFRVGLAKDIDLADSAKWPPGHALNPQVNGLHWSWQGGFIHLALEGRRPAAKGAPDGFSFHLARESRPMMVELPVVFRGGGPVTLTIAFDLAKLFDGLDFDRDGNSTHSREGDELAPRMKGNVARAFRVTATNYDLLRPLAPDPAIGTAYPAGTRPLALRVTDRFPQVSLPPDNPLTVEGAALGRRLFGDAQLSINGAQSCATCHQQSHAFSDPRPVSLGAEGQRGARNAMPLFNLAWHGAMFWDGRAKTLRDQIIRPIQDEDEMHETLPGVIAKLERDPTYPEEFARAFGSSGITAARLAKAIEQFLLTLVSQDSRFDRAARKLETLTEEEKRGLQLFVTEFDPARGLRGADCFHCHGGTLFTDHEFHHNGLLLAPEDPGRQAVTGNEADRGKFKTPSLRNVALTAPYMHDGRFRTLEEVVEHYSGPMERTGALDPNLAKHPEGGLQLTAEEKQALVAFLKTLSDEAFIAVQPGEGH
ncbi:MAG: MbnP family protein [Chthoniobacteraceae bacterium]